MRWMNPVLSLCLLAGCASQSPKQTVLLGAPTGTKPAVALQMEHGMGQFDARDYAGAEQTFRQTIAAEPNLAEAHYNLGMALETQGNKTEARKHFIEAANLAPGNKVIWNSPAFQDRTKSMGYNVDKKSYQDSTYKGF